MFLKNMIERNPKLINASFQLHQEGLVLPDTFIVDLDTLKVNAKLILDEAKKKNIELYFMLKQLGRNPLIAKELVQLGYKGAVVVDYKEALVMMRHDIPISNIGHLVQTPKSLLKKCITYGCEYFTVFSIEKVQEINDVCKELGIKQKLLIKVVGEEDYLYSGQEAGILLSEIETFAKQVDKLEFVEISGVTSFPSFLYDEDTNSIEPTNNMKTLCEAKETLQKCGVEIENLNAPSTTCVFTLSKMDGYDVNSGEPGHGLTGTTPLHAKIDCIEIPCVTYVSEISHNFYGHAYCYGGGYYRRSHIENALVGKSSETAKLDKITPPSLESIDYYFRLSKEHAVSDAVITAFRFQIFVTRSNVAIVEGIQEGKPHIKGIYTSLGDEFYE